MVLGTPLCAYDVPNGVPCRAWEKVMDDWEEIAQDVLNRMRDNFNAGKGVRISYRELQALNISFIGETWNMPDPRDEEE